MNKEQQGKMTVEDWLKDNKLGQDIWRFKYKHGEETLEQWFDRVSGGDKDIRRLIKEKKFLFGGRTLSNRGTGNGADYMNCFSNGYVPDNYEGIMQWNTEIGLTFKAEGGQGLSLSKIRPKGSLIKGLYETEGIIPFMEIFNTTTKSTSQGSHRRGALLMSLDIWHKDAEDFITIKSDKERINNANLSLEIDDEFMQIVKDNINVNDDIVIPKTFICGNGSKIIYEVKPVKLFKLLCYHAHKSAEPGTIYTNQFRKHNLMEFVSDYEVVTGNPCVAYDTKVLTDKGEIEIINLVDKKVNVWNGCEWSEVIPHITGFNQPMKKITFSNGAFLRCTNYHNFILADNSKIEAKDLKVGMSLVEYILPNAKETITLSVTEVIDSGVDDTVYCLTEPKNHTCVFNGVLTGQCGEQSLPRGMACCLSSFNLSQYVLNEYSANVAFDYASFSKDVYSVVKAMNDIVDESSHLHALQIQRDMSFKYRNIGIGVMGIADMLVKMNIVYGSKESLFVLDNISRFLFREAVFASVALAEKDGNFDGYSDRIWDATIFKDNFSDEEIQAFRDKGKLRNCSLISYPPTGTLGTMLNISTGIEPFFALSYTRKTESLGGEDKYHNVYIGEAKYYMDKFTTNELPNTFICSENIHWKDRIAVQSVLQKHVDTAISSTVNLPRETTIEEVEKLYIEAWDKKLKGVTIYRTGSRDAILSTESPKGTNKDVSAKKVSKRPKVLEADYYQSKVKGETFCVIVGLLDNKPYEVFAFKLSDDKKIPNHKGKIIKVKKQHYSFTSDHITIDDLILTTDKIEERASTLYASMLMRHGADIEFIVKTAKKVDDNITSFSSAMCRVLSRYIENKETGEKCPECGGKLIRSGGCIECHECGYSRCG